MQFEAPTNLRAGRTHAAVGQRWAPSGRGGDRHVPRMAFADALRHDQFDASDDAFPRRRATRTARSNRVHARDVAVAPMAEGMFAAAAVSPHYSIRAPISSGPGPHRPSMAPTPADREVARFEYEAASAVRAWSAPRADERAPDRERVCAYGPVHHDGVPCSACRLESLPAAHNGRAWTLPPAAPRPRGDFCCMRILPWRNAASQISWRPRATRNSVTLRLDA